MTDTSTTPQKESVAPSAPSKNALKKAAKLAKKVAKGNGDMKASDGSQGGPSSHGATVPKASGLPNEQGAKANSGPSMYLDTEGFAALKCLAAARLFDANVEIVATSPAGGFSFASGCVVAVGSTLIFGPNAICRYFSYAGRPGSMEGGEALPVDVEEWIEWEASTLAIAEQSIAEARKAGRAPSSEVRAAFQYLEERLTGRWLTSTDSASLADVVVGVSLKAIVDALVDDKVMSGYPNVQAYVKRWGETDLHSQAASQLAEIRKAAEGPAVKAGLQASLMSLFDMAMFRAWPKAKEFGVTSSSVVKCTNPKHGDFQCNAAMPLYKSLKGTPDGPSNPMVAAKTILGALRPSPLIQSTSVAPGGFINIHLRSAFINKRIANIVKNGPEPPEVKPAQVVVDFSSPNIAKEMHVGHLRSTIIGETICRLLEFCGHTVLRHNHVGDWGTQFGMLINYMREAYPNFLENPPDIGDLTTFYKAAKKRFDESEEFKEASRNTVVELQSGDPACREAWTLLCDISRREFQKVYDRLEVTLEERGESFYNEMIPGTIDRLDSTGLLDKDDGADIVRLEHFTYPLIVRKRDGGFGYDSTDMAAIEYRLKTLKCDWIIAITDAGQATHFQMIFDTARKAGWVGEHVRLDHLGFGVVQGEDGRKFKTRSGETVRLVDLLDEAVRRMAASIQERVDTGKATASAEAAPQVAAEMGYGAVKYFDLKQHPGTSYVFSYDRMLSTSGNTAVYLQFAHARLASILRKAEEEKYADLAEVKSAPEMVSVEHESERALAFELLVFSDVVEACLADLAPNRLCEYLYTLATRFTEFVTNCRVLGSPEQHSRLLLCEATGVIMRKCFSLLAMNALYRI